MLPVIVNLRRRLEVIKEEFEGVLDHAVFIFEIVLVETHCVRFPYKRHKIASRV